MHPSSPRAFGRHQEHDLKHPSSVDLITTKQNKLPSFIDGLALGNPHVLFFFFCDGHFLIGLSSISSLLKLGFNLLKYLSQ
jgi:hypothetical protein